VFRRWLFLIIAAAVIALDQLTKYLIRVNIPLDTSLEEVWRLTIVHIQNTGAAFGIFTNQTIFLSIIAVLGLIVIVLFYRQIGRTNLLAGISLGVVFGGAIGNLVDRLRFGYVTDFLYVRLWGDFYWPAFNVADSSISVGIVLLILFIFTGIKTKDEHKPSAAG
jgi:signal peptidase II